MRKKQYFRKGDLIIYMFIFSIFLFLFASVFSLKSSEGKKAEIYVNNRLVYVFNLQKDEKNIFVNTDIGGVNVRIKDYKIRVVTSNSPLKLNVKQGWIGKTGEVIIGLPDKMIIKIVGDESEENSVDFIVG